MKLSPAMLCAAALEVLESLPPEQVVWAPMSARFTAKQMMVEIANRTTDGVHYANTLFRIASAWAQRAGDVDARARDLAERVRRLEVVILRAGLPLPDRTPDVEPIEALAADASAGAAARAEAVQLREERAAFQAAIGWTGDVSWVEPEHVAALLAHHRRRADEAERKLAAMNAAPAPATDRPVTPTPPSATTPQPKRPQLRVVPRART
ncbi:MAG: hypothetical protein ACTHU0_21930 [Kofleriaceae bacterium]